LSVLFQRGGVGCWAQGTAAWTAGPEEERRDDICDCIRKPD